MKTVHFFIAIFSMLFLAMAEAAPVSARYVKFEGYYSSNNGAMGLYEIEVYAGGLNVAKGKIATVNSGFYPERLTDGNSTGATYFASNQNNPGPASDGVPHWIRLDLGSDQPIDRIKVYFWNSFSYSYGLFFSSDGTNWTQVSRNDLATGTVENDPSAPFVKIESAAMRPGTTLMDVVYRVTDPDDTTVKTRALAFVDGVRSFAKVLKPVAFVEGTAAKLGDAIPVNENHTLTWDVGADWNIDLGQIKFEVLAMDGRGLLPMDWIAIPAAGGHPQTTVSKNSPTNADVLNALFWCYADGDTGLSLANGILSGNANSGTFNNVALVNGSTIQLYSTPFIFKRMNLDIDDGVVATVARAGLTTPQSWHAVNRAYAGACLISAWGDNTYNTTTIPTSLSGVITAIAAGGSYNLALRSNGTVVSWGYNINPSIPTGLNGIIAIATGGNHGLALKSDGSVVAWGNNNYGQAAMPTGLSGITAIAAGSGHSLLLKSDGTVLSLGSYYNGNTFVPMITPDGLTGVISIAAAGHHSLALKSNGTVVGWGRDTSGQTTIPSGLSEVIAVVAGGEHSLALKSDGTVVGWGYNGYGQSVIPAGLSNVIAIAAGGTHSLALKSDGTVVAWGNNRNGQVTGVATTSSPYTATANPLTLNGVIVSGVSNIAAGGSHSLILKAKAP